MAPKDTGTSKKKYVLEVPRSQPNARIDSYCSNNLNDCSRNTVKKLIQSGHIKLIRGGSEISLSASSLIRAGDKIEISFPTLTSQLKLDILFENDRVLFINKPSGVLTHPKNFQLDEEETVYHALEALVEPGVERNGLVHRLDRFTTGVMVIAKTHKSLLSLKQQFAAHTAQKIYIAVAEGQIPNKQYELNWPIERDPKKPSRFRVGQRGKPAQTNILMTNSKGRYSLVALKPLSGRTHQVRLHLKQLGHPVVGDLLYGAKKGRANRYLLHSHSLTLEVGDKKPKTVFAPIPPDMSKFIDDIGLDTKGFEGLK